MESRMADLQRAYEEKLLEKKAAEFEALKRRVEAGDVLSAAEQQQLDNLTMRTKMLQMQREGVSSSPSPAASSAVDVQLQAMSAKIAEQEKQLAQRLQMLELLAQKMDGFDPAKLFEQINRLVSQGVHVGGSHASSGASGGASSAAELKSRIESLQKVLFDPSSTPQQIDKTNIDLEKAMAEYEKTPEYRAEMQSQKDAKKQKHEAANKAALEKMRRKYTAENLKSDSALLLRVGEHPVLKLIIMETSQIMKIYAGTWKSFSSHGLELDEVRAIRAALPNTFTADQRVQASFAESLDEKIEALSSAPSASPQPPVHRAPPRPPAAIARAKNSAPPSGDIFAEIRARAQQRGGAGLSAPSATRTPAPASAFRIPLPPLPGAPKAQPPLPPKPASATATAPLQAPVSLPPPPPKPSSTSASSTVDAAVPSAAQKSRAALEQLVRSLLNTQQIDERSVAQLTRAAVTELKQLAALRVAAMPFESSRMQDRCSVLVSTIKNYLLERRNGGDKASLEKARAALANTFEAIKKLSNELAA